MRPGASRRAKISAISAGWAMRPQTLRHTRPEDLCSSYAKRCPYLTRRDSNNVQDKCARRSDPTRASVSGSRSKACVNVGPRCRTGTRGRAPEHGSSTSHRQCPQPAQWAPVKILFSQPLEVIVRARGSDRRLPVLCPAVDIAVLSKPHPFQVKNARTAPRAAPVSISARRRSRTKASRPGFLTRIAANTPNNRPSARNGDNT